MLRPACLLLTSVLALASTACASRVAPPPLAPAVPPRLAAVPVPPPPPTVPPGHLPRVEVDRILTTQGPVWVLRQIIVDPVLRRDGKFTGWRVVGLPEEWSRIDVKPGDVITRVNSLSVEKPENFWDVWASVARSPEVKIELTRDGAARQVVIPIDGAPSAETARALEHAPGPPPAVIDGPPAAQRSIQLGGAAAEPTNEDAY